MASNPPSDLSNLSDLLHGRPSIPTAPCMLTRQTYTNSAPAKAAILPGVAAHLRRQVAREQARLLEMGCSIENPKPANSAIISVSGRKLGTLYFSGSATRAPTPPFEREFSRFRSTKLKSAPARAGNIATITRALSQGKSVTQSTVTAKNPPSAV